MASTTYGTVLGRNIAAARTRADISQASLAARMQFLGFDQWVSQTVSKSERNARRVQAEEVVGLAIALETSVRLLMVPNEDGDPVDLQRPGLREMPPAYLRGVIQGGTSGGKIVWDGDKPAFVAREEITDAWKSVLGSLGVNTDGI